MRMQGKVAIITGGAVGIGRATALLFGREGAKLVIADMDAEKGTEFEGTLKEMGLEGFFVKADVRESGEVEGVVEATMKRFGRIDTLVNNAGVAASIPVVELSEEDWDRIVDTNLKGTYLCCKYAIPKMIEGGGGTIVNLGSVHGLVGKARVAAYNAAKAGVINLTRNMALDYAPHNIRVNAVCPGYVETEMVRRAINRNENPAKAYEELVQLHPMGRLGRPEEIAHAILFLASDESSFATGSSLVIDGGYTAQ